MAGELTLRVEIKNATWVEQRLKAIDKKVRGKIITKAIRAGAKVIQTRAKANAPFRTGMLKKAVTVRSAKYIGRRRKKRGEVAMNAQIGAGNFKGHTFYGAFQEFGWKTGKRTPKGKQQQQRRQIPGKHFMERAGKQGEREAVSVIQNTIISGLQEAGK